MNLYRIRVRVAVTVAGDENVDVHTYIFIPLTRRYPIAKYSARGFCQQAETCDIVFLDSEQDVTSRRC